VEKEEEYQKIVGKGSGKKIIRQKNVNRQILRKAAKKHYPV
jgi:hypothetical protein